MINISVIQNIGNILQVFVWTDLKVGFMTILVSCTRAKSKTSGIKFFGTIFGMM